MLRPPRNSFRSLLSVLWIRSQPRWDWALWCWRQRGQQPQGDLSTRLSRRAEDVRDRVHVLFAVDTLEYLHRGGRIGGAKRFLGTALNIKPVLHLEDGRVEALVQVRTKRKAISRMLEIAEERLGGKRAAEVAVLDIDAPEEGDLLAEEAKERLGVTKVYRTTVSPVIGTHAGPGTVGIALYPEH
jgi:DegV family protein with EDD domain